MRMQDVLRDNFVLILHFSSESRKVIAVAVPSKATLADLMARDTTLETYANTLPLPDGADSVLVLKQAQVRALPNPDRVAYQHWRVSTDGAVFAALEETPTHILT